MARIRLDYAPRAFADLERLIDFLLETDPAAAQSLWPILQSAILILRDHPLIGRPAEHGMRELVISRGKTGYIALYRYDAQRTRILILAIRHQREAGFIS